MLVTLTVIGTVSGAGWAGIVAKARSVLPSTAAAAAAAPVRFNGATDSEPDSVAG